MGGADPIIRNAASQHSGYCLGLAYRKPEPCDSAAVVNEVEQDAWRCAVRQAA